MVHVCEHYLVQLKKKNKVNWNYNIDAFLATCKISTLVQNSFGSI